VRNQCHSEEISTLSILIRVIRRQRIAAIRIASTSNLVSDSVVISSPFNPSGTLVSAVVPLNACKSHNLLLTVVDIRDVFHSPFGEQIISVAVSIRRNVRVKQPCLTFAHSS
jgi:hypothetical protein